MNGLKTTLNYDKLTLNKNSINPTPTNYYKTLSIVVLNCGRTFLTDPDIVAADVVSVPEHEP